jgi:hypothetical protein
VAPEDLGQPLDFIAHGSLSQHLDQQQLALHMVLFGKQQHLDHLDELVELLQDLLDDLVAARGDDGHA